MVNRVCRRSQQMVTLYDIVLASGEILRRSETLDHVTGFVRFWNKHCPDEKAQAVPATYSRQIV